MGARRFNKPGGGQQRQIKAGTAYYELQAKDAGFTAAARSAGNTLKSLGAAIATVGAKVGALGALITAPLTAAAKLFKDFTTETATMAKKLDVSIESMSALAYAAERAGTSMQALGTDAEAWAKVIEKVGGAEEMQKLMVRARELGAVLRDEDAAAAEAYRIALVDLRAVLRGITNTIGATVAPILVEMANRTLDITKNVAEWVRGNKELIASAFRVGKTVAAVGAALTVAGTGLAGVGTVLGIAAAGFTVMVGAVTALLSPVGLAAAAIAGLAGYLIYTRGVGATAISALTEAFGRLKDTAVETFSGISDALSAGDLKLGAQILWATLKGEWLRGTAVLDDLWQQSQQSFSEAFERVAEKFAVAWEGLRGMFAAVADEIKSTMTAAAAAMQGAFEDASKVIGKALWNVFYVIGEIDARIRRAVGQLKSAGQFFGLINDDRKNSRGGNIVGGPVSPLRGAAWIGGKIMSGIFRDQPYKAPPPGPKRQYSPTRVTKIDGVPVDGSAPAPEPPAQKTEAPPIQMPNLRSIVSAAIAAAAAVAAQASVGINREDVKKRIADADAERERLLAEAAAGRKEKARQALGALSIPDFGGSLERSVSGTFNGAVAAQALGSGGGILNRIANGVERWQLQGERIVNAVDKIPGTPQF